MADKNKNETPDDSLEPRSNDKITEAEQDSATHDLGVDLSADPEFLALAAEFDAAISQRSEAREGAEPEGTDGIRQDAQGVPDDLAGCGIANEASSYTGEPEGEDEMEQPGGPDFIAGDNGLAEDAAQVEPGQAADEIPIDSSSFHPVSEQDLEELKEVDAAERSTEADAEQVQHDAEYGADSGLGQPSMPKTASEGLALTGNEESDTPTTRPDSSENWFANSELPVSSYRPSEQELAAVASAGVAEEGSGLTPDANKDLLGVRRDSGPGLEELAPSDENFADNAGADASYSDEAQAASGPASDLEETLEQAEEGGGSATVAAPAAPKRSRFGRRKGDRAEAQEKPVLPRLKSGNATEPTILSRIYDSLSLVGIFVLTGLFLLQVLPGLQADRLLWYSDELRQADVLKGVFSGDWLQTYLNGKLYQESPPLYFWFLLGLHKLIAFAGLDLGEDYAKLLYAGAAVSGLLFIWASYALARVTARLDLRGAFASGCVLLSVMFLQFFYHYSSLDLFFAAFIIASHIFMFRGLMRERAPLLMGLAFLCAAVALMTKGALGLGLPLLSAILFAFWRGKPGRLFRADFLVGLVFALLPMLVWLGSIWATGQHEAVVSLLREQVWIKAFGKAAHSEPWWYYLAVLPAMWLPWTFLLLLVPFHRIFSRSALETMKSARHGDRQGLAFVWIAFLSSFALLTLISNKQPVYLLPLMGPLAVLTGRGLLQLAPLKSAILQRVMALFFFLLAVAFVLLPVYYSPEIPSFFSWLGHLNLPRWEVKVNGIFLLAVVMLLNTCLLIGVVKARRPESTLLVLVIGALLFSYPLSTMSMPSLDGVVSSRSPSIEIHRYSELGYYPVSFGVYPGVFSYYSGVDIEETGDWVELERLVGERQKIVIAMSARRWQEWTQHPGFTEVMRFWMFSNEYVLLLRNTDLNGLQDDMRRVNGEGGSEFGGEPGGEERPGTPFPVGTPEFGIPEGAAPGSGLEPQATATPEEMSGPADPTPTKPEGESGQDVGETGTPETRGASGNSVTTGLTAVEDEQPGEAPATQPSEGLEPSQAEQEADELARPEISDQAVDSDSVIPEVIEPQGDPQGLSQDDRPSEPQAGPGNPQDDPSANPEPVNLQGEPAATGLEPASPARLETPNPEDLENLPPYDPAEEILPDDLETPLDDSEMWNDDWASGSESATTESSDGLEAEGEKVGIAPEQNGAEAGENAAAELESSGGGVSGSQEGEAALPSESDAVPSSAVDARSVSPQVEEDVTDDQPLANEEPLPDNVPMVDTPEPDDPFSPVGPEW